MAITTVLFDLDGTLLPMDQDVFISDYFTRLAKKLAPYGYETEKLYKTIWAGTGAMVKNDGGRRNEQAFWDVFFASYGEGAGEHIPVFDEFYAVDFDSVRSVCGFDSRADETVKLVKSLGLGATLATNPVFPSAATMCRIRWAGLDSGDFELVTTYENSSFCKPSLGYYREIVSRLGVTAEECLMVGNDVKDDMVASQLGMKVFLLTDNLINKDGADVSLYPNGGFDELKEYIREVALDV